MAFILKYVANNGNASPISIPKTIVFIDSIRSIASIEEFIYNALVRLTAAADILPNN